MSLRIIKKEKPPASLYTFKLQMSPGVKKVYYFLGFLMLYALTLAYTFLVLPRKSLSTS